MNGIIEWLNVTACLSVELIQAKHYTFCNAELDFRGLNCPPGLVVTLMKLCAASCHALCFCQNDKTTNTWNTTQWGYILRRLIWTATVVEITIRKEPFIYILDNCASCCLTHCYKEYHFWVTHFNNCLLVNYTHKLYIIWRYHAIENPFANSTHPQHSKPWIPQINIQFWNQLNIYMCIYIYIM